MRSYNDMCGMAHALDLVGERWALLVVRELMLGPKRYTDLRHDLPGISTNVLSQRLADLEATGVVRRRRLPPPAASTVYELTEWGQELEPIVCRLGRWGARSPRRPSQGAHLSTTAFILSLRTNVDPAAAAATAVAVDLRIGPRWFRARSRDGRFTVVPQAPDVAGASRDPADATIEADEARPLAALVYGRADLDTAVRDGTVHHTGDSAALARFLRLFSLPDLVNVP